MGQLPGHKRERSAPVKDILRRVKSTRNRMEGSAVAKQVDEETRQVQVETSEEELVHSDPWFSDGNIVLRTQGLAFKVHRGQLERHSDVFRGIFSIPQPADIPLSEGIPILDLHDSADDLRCFLRALYDGLYYKNLSANDFSVISSVMRISTKYLFDHLQERSASRLSMDWPNTLAGWDSRELEAMDALGRYNPRTRFAQPIYVINFAREVGHLNILPSAFYDLCRYSPSKIIEGAPLLPAPEIVSSMSTVSQAGQEGQSPDGVMNVLLSPSDARLVLLGRESAQRAAASFIEDELSSRSIAADCHNREREGGRVCRESFYFIMLNLLRAVGGIAHGRECDPLYTLTQAVEMTSRSDFSDGLQLCSLKICAACKLDFAHSVALGREQIWSKIPSWFGMEDFTGKEIKV
ncbi:hypothetical protein SCHPADRAFT_925803 [Schizopora paradoxa]|uniref:BTB domain-containing protein n=1 Tax=Schizopora paradoxa TaxID=27342 RepID=A0A0H2SK72_9AGAM|nr:hypothetical protein SCHPADRAFT_925803 [Schizopora paradoxa]